MPPGSRRSRWWLMIVQATPPKHRQSRLLDDSEHAGGDAHTPRPPSISLYHGEIVLLNITWPLLCLPLFGLLERPARLTPSHRYLATVARWKVSEPSGVCQTCPNPPVPGYAHCATCLRRRGGVTGPSQPLIPVAPSPCHRCRRPTCPTRRSMALLKVTCSPSSPRYGCASHT